MVAGVFDFWSLNGLPASPPTTGTPLRQLGFLPAGLGANLAVRRDAFEAVGGFAEELLVGEDIDLCWRLQLGGFRFVVASDAVVAKRERPEFGRCFRHGDRLRAQRPRPLPPTPGRRGPARSAPGRPSRGCGCSLLPPGSSPLTSRAIEWAHAAGMRTGRLPGRSGSGSFFP